MNRTVHENKVKHRAHRMLFDDSLPFKPKREPRKDIYKRKPKHKGRDEE